MTLAFRKEDHACPPQLCIMGYLPETFDVLMAGTVCAPAYAVDTEIGKKIEAANIPLPKAPDTIWIAPYHLADFEPDIVLVYGNSAQVTRLAQGYAYYTGDGVKSNTLGRLACASYINKVFVTQEPAIVIPGGGERVFGSTQDDELVFAVPAKFLETTARGVEAVHKAGYARFPTGFHGVISKPRMPGKYMKNLIPKKG